MSVALAAQLREGTKKSHTMAENTGFVSCFLKGVVDKASYRAAMDELPIDQAMADRIVEEANHAFHLNMNMFKELEGNLVAAIGKLLFGFLTRRQRAGSTEAATA